MAAGVDMVAPVYTLFGAITAAMVPMLIILFVKLLAGFKVLAVALITAVALLETPEPPEVLEMLEVHRLD
jgi:hypothetical protein